MKSVIPKTIISLSLAAGVIAVPGIASAESHPIAGCGAGLVLRTIDDANDAIDWSIYSDDEEIAIRIEVAGVDRNDDGYLCTKHRKPNLGQDKHWGGTNYEVTWIDDNRARGRVG